MGCHQLPQGRSSSRTDRVGTRGLAAWTESVQRLTEDHKPNRPDEKARVEAAGGAVEWCACFSNPRCPQGSLQRRGLSACILLVVPSWALLWEYPARGLCYHDSHANDAETRDLTVSSPLCCAPPPSPPRSLCLSHCVSLAVSPSPYLPLCLSHRLSHLAHCVSLTASLTASLTTSLTVSPSPSRSHGAGVGAGG